ncbi:uncharacterized protein LOC130728924 [Lotus japonicus]|uniref:uncharacterized protein LOC130728924 n=1 Tax=Lotus japonicus TaxID=34305 RepID=UPI00258DD94D|nr:uncharacterized protein LOC130728924 [Lotus japonicus]
MDEKIKSSPNTLVQCRICHDEDEDSNMETPCSCCGTLKYAHRKCVQRWCNAKGDNTCEICQQQLKGYVALPPAPLFHFGGSPINFGETTRMDLHNHQFIAMFTTNHEFTDPDFEYSAPSTRSLICYRIIAIIFLVLLVLRHTLPIIFILSGAEGYSLTVSTLIVLRIIGMLVPVYIMVKAIISIQRLQFVHEDHHSPMQSHEENGMEGQSQLRVIQIQ